MATLMKPTAPEQREQNLNIKLKLPRDRYACRITEESFEVSKNSGNPMVILESEIVAPDTIKNPADGSLINIAGTKLKKQYLVLRVKGDDGQIDQEKSQKAFDRYSDLRSKLGVPIDEEGVDIENPPKIFKGIVFDAICDGEEVTQRRDPTPEQRAKKQQGEEIKDSSGKPIRVYFSYVVDILGLADGDAQASAASRAF